MKQGSPHSSRDILSEVQSQFARWRQNRKRGTRIPEALWRAAVDAARESGVSRAAQALGLDYYRLKKRAESTHEDSESGPAVCRTELMGSEKRPTQGWRNTKG